MRKKSTEEVRNELKYFSKDSLQRGDIKEISYNTGVHQSQVGRILKGNFAHISSNVEKICKYANISIYHSNKKTDVNLSNKLINALNEVWDGSEEVELLLVSVINGLKPAITQGLLKNNQRHK
ncbi:hypothetical protein WLQ65_22640 [Pseudoalteromonas piscicida]|uniref:hypothetical protein n=1 Tax=Pseudoalteromonas piscicida TaxID=43662 RepID=UPI0030C945BD